MIYELYDDLGSGSAVAVERAKDGAPASRYVWLRDDGMTRGPRGFYPVVPKVLPHIITAQVFERWWSEAE